MSRLRLVTYELALLVTMIVWGVNFPILKAVLDVMHPHALNVFRLSTSALVLGVLYHRQQRKAGTSLFAPLRTHGWRLFGLGLIGYVLYQFFFITGIDQTTAGNAALLMASSPLWTAVFAHVFRFESLRRAAWMGLWITFFGAGFIVLGSSKGVDFGNASFLGNMLIMGAAVFWGAYTAFSKPMTRQMTPTGITFLGLLFALPFLLALGLPYFDTLQWDRVDGWVVAAILYSGGLSTGIAVLIWNAAIKQVGPSHTAAFGNLVPVVALLSGAWMLGETITLIQLLGGSLILGGLFVMRRTRSTTSSLPPQRKREGMV